MEKYRFEQIAFNSTVKKMPTDDDRKTYIGLEHLNPGRIMISRWGSAVPLKGEKLVMKKGDVLLGKRNAYLRRAAISPHDGIFSAHGMVLRPNEKIVDKSFFPLFIASDYFFDVAIKISVGSLSPTVNWKDLRTTEFHLPDLHTQRRIADVLWSINSTMEAYRRLISATDELVKSQFIELVKSGKWEVVKAGTVMKNMRNGLSPSTKGTHREKVLTLSAITQGHFDADAWKDGVFDACPPEEKRITSSEFYMCRGNGNKSLVGIGVYSPESRPDLVFPDTVIAAGIDTRMICLPYLSAAWKSESVRNQIESSARTTNGTYKINQNIISNIVLVLPPLPLQERFAAFVRQSDKSKFEMEHLLQELTASIHIVSL